MFRATPDRPKPEAENEQGEPGKSETARIHGTAGRSLKTQTPPHKIDIYNDIDMLARIWHHSHLNQSHLWGKNIFWAQSF
jgi:hypothetical protein